MDGQCLESRRNFLKAASAGAAGIALSSANVSYALGDPRGGWRRGMEINPSVSNMKVVCCYDESMIVNKLASDFVRQNENVNKSVIVSNMDEMAKKLTNASSASEAWHTIFRKPDAKTWDQVKAAIKVNASNIANMPRAAVVGKVCTELINLGVPAGNIIIYDSCANASGAGKYGDGSGKPVAGIPSGVIVSTASPADADYSNWPQVPVGSSTLRCSPVIARERTDKSIDYIADILINCAVNKGHDQAYGGFTMLMKNHTGTLKYDHPSPREMIDENRCEAIIGRGTSGEPCRQQLCIVDSLWASSAGPLGAWSHVPCRIVMGTLAPTVDYLTAEKIRKPATIMGAQYNAEVVNNWLSAFGYKSSDPVWLQFSPSTLVGSAAAPNGSEGTLISVSLSHDARCRAETVLFMPARNAPMTLGIFDMRGRGIRHIALPPGPDHEIAVAWGLYGHRLPPGAYSVRCSMGGIVKTAMVTVGN